MTDVVPSATEYEPEPIREDPDETEVAVPSPMEEGDANAQPTPPPVG
jgi:hypothetical protein